MRAYRIGVVYAARGDVDRALAWLERAVAQRDTDAEWMKLDPLLRPVRGDARFAALLRSMNLPLD